jgi:hypothetical protein
VFSNASSRWYLRSVVALCSATLLSLGLAACGGNGPLESTGLDDLSPVLRTGCTVTTAGLFNGGPGRDGIPALVNPMLVTLDHPTAGMSTRMRSGQREPSAPLPHESWGS